MTQACSLSSSTAGANGKSLPNGIHVVGADRESAPRVEGMPSGEETPSPWGYLFIHHYVAGAFDKRLEEHTFEGGFVPKCFIHRTVFYKRKRNGKGVAKEEKPTVSGLVFLQGGTAELSGFLRRNFPQYHLVNNCTTGRPASIPHSVMKPFMRVMESEPKRVTFLRDPFVKFAKDHVKLRVLTGILAGQEGYVVRILRDRQLVMDIGGYAVAVSGVHNEDFEVAE